MVKWIILLVVFSISVAGLFSVDYFNTLRFSNFFTYYYLHPSPQKVPQMLRTYLGLRKFKEHSQSFGGAVTAYSFGRIAAINPRLLIDYVCIYDKANKYEKLFLLNTFLVFNDNYVRQHLMVQNEPDSQISAAIKTVLSQPPLKQTPFLWLSPTDASHFDFLWAEFFITGTKKPVEQIMNFLDSEEIVGKKLFEWLATIPQHDELVEMKRILSESYSIELNTITHELLYPGDLDVRFSIGTKNINSKDKLKLRKLLNLSQEEWQHIGDKAVAAWSLQANARQHKQIMVFCKEEAEKRQTKSAFEIARAYNGACPSDKRIFPPITIARKLPANVSE